MKKNIIIFYIFALATALSSCAATNPYNISDDNYSILSNWIEKNDGEQTSYLFNHSDDKYLDWGWFKARGDTNFKVPTGHRSVIVHIVYAPHGIWKLGGASNLYEAFVRIEFNAERGKCYRANSTITNSIAKIWVEEVGGNKVSDILSTQIIQYDKKYK